MSTIQQSLDGNVLTLTFDRPDSYNAFNGELRREFKATLDEHADDDEVRCLRLTGAGNTFSAGGDIDRMRERLQTDLDPVAFERELRTTAHELIETLYRFPVPTIAEVQGVAVGMGLSIALACDVIIAARDARFAASFTNVALGPDTGVSYTLPRRIGTHRALELFYTGEIVDGERAEKVGMINRAVSTDQVHDEATELAERIANGPADAYAATKRLVKDNLERDIEDALDSEAALQTILFTTDDHSEGVEAFLEKREPTFRGRDS